MKALSRVWWVLGLRGLFAVLFALLAFLCPGHALRMLILLFGCYALADGLFALWAGLSASTRKDFMRASLVEGFIGVALGIATLFLPHVTELALIYLVATWAILTGIFEIFAVDRNDRVTLNEWPLGISGAASMFAGALLFLYPRQGAYLLSWLLGGYALVFGIILLHLAWRLFWHEQHKHPHAPLHPV